MSTPDPAVAACLERTRSAVLNVLVAVGAGIGASGLILRQRDRGALLWSEQEAGRVAHAALICLIVGSLLVKRIVGARSALLAPETRALRFFRSHVWSAIVGAMAIPLGFAYGWAIRPRLDAVAPYWVAALATGALAWPRAYELEDFDTPLPARSEPSS